MNTEPCTRLYYDTETNGLPNDRLAPDDPLQARLVQLAAMLYDPEWNVVGSVNMYVKPDGWIISDFVSSKNGITQATLERYGLPIRLVIAAYTNLRARADEELAHNIAFDDKIMQYELARLGGSSLAVPSKRNCTMTIASPIVNLPPTPKMRAAGFNKPKPPSLTECHSYFFGTEFEGAHDAMNDVLAMVRVHKHILLTGGAPHTAASAPVQGNAG